MKEDSNGNKALQISENVTSQGQQHYDESHMHNDTCSSTSTNEDSNEESDEESDREWLIKKSQWIRNQ